MTKRATITRIKDLHTTEQNWLNEDLPSETKTRILAKIGENLLNTKPVTINPNLPGSFICTECDQFSISGTDKCGNHTEKPYHQKTLNPSKPFSVGGLKI